MERRRISSGSPWEPVVGFSRAVRVGDRVVVAGTIANMSGGADPPPDAYGQARRCLEIIGEALAEAGATFADVVRTRMYLTPNASFDEVAKAHGEIFAEIRPASTALYVTAFVDPRFVVEIEAEAVIAVNPR
jgi:enamine deaminase RidA (YjgF/YER057c/UK114 family)